MDTVVTTDNGVKVIGYSDMPSRVPATSSNLYGNNVAKFLLSVGPATNPALEVCSLYMTAVCTVDMITNVCLMVCRRPSSWTSTTRWWTPCSWSTRADPGINQAVNLQTILILT